MDTIKKNSETLEVVIESEVSEDQRCPNNVEASPSKGKGLKVLIVCIL